MFGRRAKPVYTETTTTTRQVKPSLMTRLRAKKTTPRVQRVPAAGHSNTTVTKSPRFSSRRTNRRVGGPVVGTTHHGTTTTAAPRRKTSVGDKISGAMLKLKGSIEHKPGKKAAGTRRMHGTDGRGARRIY